MSNSPRILQNVVTCPVCKKKMTLEVEIPNTSDTFITECFNSNCKANFVLKVSYTVALEVFQLKPLTKKLKK